MEVKDIARRPPTPPPINPVSSDALVHVKVIPGKNLKAMEAQIYDYEPPLHVMVDFQLDPDVFLAAIELGDGWK